MKYVCACPKHGRGKQEGREGDFDFSKNKKYGSIGKVHAWLCFSCNQYYINADNVKKGVIDIKTKLGRLINNAESFMVLPNTIYVFKNSDKKQIFKEHNFTEIQKLIDCSGHIVQVPGKYIKRNDEFYISEGTLRQCKIILETNNVKVIPWDNHQIIKELENITYDND